MNFIKNTLVGGLLVVVPVMLLYLGLKEVAELLVAMVDPIADLFPEYFPENVRLPGIIAALVLTAVSFIAGLAMRSELLSRIASSIKRALLDKLPMYKMLERISAALIAGDKTSFAAAMYRHGNGELEPAYIVEDHGDGRLTILIPLSPTAFAGHVRIVSKTDVDYLDCSFDELSLSVTHFGIGMKDAVGKRTQS